MHKDVDAIEALRSPLVIKLVQAMLGDDPVDPALLAKVGEPERLDARARTEAQLRAEDQANLGRHQAGNSRITASGATSATSTR